MNWSLPKCAPARDQTHNLGMCPDCRLKPQPFGILYCMPLTESPCQSTAQSVKCHSSCTLVWRSWRNLSPRVVSPCQALYRHVPVSGTNVKSVEGYIGHQYQDVQVLTGVTHLGVLRKPQLCLIFFMWEQTAGLQELVLEWLRESWMYILEVTGVLDQRQEVVFKDLPSLHLAVRWQQTVGVRQEKIRSGQRLLLTLGEY